MSVDIVSQSAALAEQAAGELAAAAGEAELARIKSSYLGKSGSIAALLREIPNLEIDQRREAGRAVNDAKKSVETLFAKRQEDLRGAALARSGSSPLK